MRVGDGASRGDEAYQRRYVVASRALDSAYEMAGLARRIERVRRASRTLGAAIVGGSTLRHGRRVGLLATSMNPLSRAHLALAETACQVARIDVLCWVATLVTVDKEDVTRAALVDRLAQTRAASRASGHALALLKGGLYVEQARAARTLLAPDAAIALIVGYDKIVQIFDPRYYADRDAALDALFAEANLVVAPRGDATEDDVRRLLSRAENRRYAKCVTYCPLPLAYQRDSSTEARALAAQGDAHRAELRALLAPEGLALTDVTGAYDASRAQTQGSFGDRYSARLSMIDALVALHREETRGLPPIRTLIDITESASPQGDALRAWIAAGNGNAANLRAALEMS